MTPKQRILAALTGGRPDRVPWSPLLAYFWEHQSEEVQAAGQVPYLEALGADPLLRGAENILPVSISWGRCHVTEYKAAGRIVRIYETPLGSLRETYVELPGTAFLAEHPVRNPGDVKILRYLHEDMILAEDFGPLHAKIREYGDRALVVPLVGVNRKTAFQSLVEQWLGTEALVYAMVDYPEVMTSCLEAMRKASLRYLEIAVRCDAEAFISWEDTSTMNINPDYFSRYIAPEINDWCDIIHGASKLYLHHACGHLKALMPLIAGTNIDALESLTPPPTGDVTLEEARDILPDRIALIGGIEPVAFESGGLAELEETVDRLLATLSGSRYILANSDSCPPGVTRDKLLAVTEQVRAFGRTTETGGPGITPRMSVRSG